MFDSTAIQELSKAEAIRAATEAVTQQPHARIALPHDFTLHDLEKFQPGRRRARGVMTSSVLEDFAAYVKAHAQDGAAAFVNIADMCAAVVLNLGTKEAPGHADNIAVLDLRMTAAFKALRNVAANGQPLTQVAAAEFIEDWSPLIQCRRDDEVIANPRAITAIRTITIEALSRQQNKEQQLSTSRSAFEQVEAKADELLPSFIDFATEPYLGLSPRTFSVRLGVRAGEKPAVTLRIVNAEQHAEEMAAELAELVRSVLGGVVPVALGTYKAAA